MPEPTAGTVIKTQAIQWTKAEMALNRQGQREPKQGCHPEKQFKSFPEKAKAGKKGLFNSSHFYFFTGDKDNKYRATEILLDELPTDWPIPGSIA